MLKKKNGLINTTPPNFNNWHLRLYRKSKNVESDWEKDPTNRHFAMSVFDWLSVCQYKWVSLFPVFVCRSVCGWGCYLEKARWGVCLHWVFAICSGIWVLSSVGVGWWTVASGFAQTPGSESTWQSSHWGPLYCSEGENREGNSISSII